jgi:pimeloyl-ACP methyl ester carboxylesterase
MFEGFASGRVDRRGWCRQASRCSAPTFAATVSRAHRSRQLIILHSKRASASDMAAVMTELGHNHFGVADHDRGGPVAFRLTLDAPERGIHREAEANSAGSGCGRPGRRAPDAAAVEETMIKLLYKPVSILVSVLGGMLAGIVFKQIWKLPAS